MAERFVVHVRRRQAPTIGGSFAEKEENKEESRREGEKREGK